MPTETSDTPGKIEHAAHGGGVRIALAQIAVAQVGVGIELQHHEVGVARREGRMAPAVSECSPPSTNGNLPSCSTLSTRPASWSSAASIGVAISGARSAATP